MTPKPCEPTTAGTVGEQTSHVQPLRVAIVDTAIAFGGTLSVSRNILKNLDPLIVDASLISACADGYVSQGFAGNRDIALVAPRVSYARLAQWKARVGRLSRWYPVRRSLEILIMASELLANIPYLIRLIFLFKRKRTDLVHLNNYAMEPLCAARLLRIPVVYHLHGLVPLTLERSARRSFKHVKAFISISRAVTESAMHAGFDPRIIYEIPNFTELEPDPYPPAMPSKPAIGIFGRVTNWKGQKEFLHSILRVFPRFPNLIVYIVGDASDSDPQYFEECRSIATSSPWATQIIFPGRVTDVTNYYRQCTLVVHASIEPEPFGMVIIEAMAQARPVVASIFGAAGEILQDGTEGFLVDPNDTAAMASRMCTLLANPYLAADMGIRGYTKVRNLYCPTSAINKFTQLYFRIAR